MKKIFIALAALTIMIASCKKSDYIADRYNMLLVHAAPGVGPVTFSLQDSKVDSNISYGHQTLYLPGIKSSAHALPSALVVLTAKPDSGLSAIVNVDLADTKSYSYYFYKNSYGIQAAYGAGGAYLLDSFSTPATGHASVRFMHVAVDAPALDLLINDIEVADNKVFYETDKNNCASGFIDHATGTVTVALRQHGTTNILYRDANVTLADGKVYTIYARGLYNSAVPTLSFGTVTHN